MKRIGLLLFGACGDRRNALGDDCRRSGAEDGVAGGLCSFPRFEQGDEKLVFELAKRPTFVVHLSSPRPIAWHAPRRGGGRGAAGPLSLCGEGPAAHAALCRSAGRSVGRQRPPRRGLDAGVAARVARACSPRGAGPPWWAARRRSATACRWTP